MTAAGIVTEFNPFHKGHAYIIGRTRAALGDNCAVICVMSGNFVQRGDCAVAGKHARAEAAVRCGADLVIELPLPYVLSSADVFAHGAVALLNSLGVVTQLSFGSETPDISALSKLARALSGAKANAVIAEKMRNGASYAAARQAAADSVAPEAAALLKSPNNLLGAEYLAALSRLGSAISPLAVHRAGAMHDTYETEAGFASATLLRRLLAEGKDVSPYLPAPAHRVLLREISDGRAPVTADALETAVLARLRALDEAAFVSLPGAQDGLGLRLMSCVSEPTLEALAQKCKTKRFALSRIRRLIFCAALGINFGTGYTTPPYVRVLAANETGLALLREISASCPLPVITKPAHAKRLPADARAIFELEARATDLYALAYPDKTRRTGGEEWRKSPVILKNSEIIEQNR